jgi:uncharacterized protein (TIGR02271 family)
MPSGSDEDRPQDRSRETLPLFAEEVVVSKQVVETARVRIARQTHERHQLIDELLARETVEIERTPIGRYVEAMPPIREEGDTIVVPVVDEVLVVKSQLLLKEEVRIRKVRSTERHQQDVTLRHQEAVVTRIPMKTPAHEESPDSGTKPCETNQE